jgi:hypothetical protein
MTIVGAPFAAEFGVVHRIVPHELLPPVDASGIARTTVQWTAVCQTLPCESNGLNAHQ